MSPISETERRQALAQIAEANRQMADRAKAPVWYHWTLGALVGGIVAVQEAPIPWILAYYVVFCAGLVLLVRAYRRRTGMWIYGYRAGRTRWVAVGGAVVFTAIMLTAVWLYRDHGLRGACLIAGLILVPAVALQGFLWQAAYRRDLGVA